MIAAAQSKNNCLCPLHRPKAARRSVKTSPAPPDCYDKRPHTASRVNQAKSRPSSHDLSAPNVTVQRQTYRPFTSTRTQAVPAAAAPTATPPTTARRVVRRATPATLTGVNGRPTLACALSVDSERPLPGDHVTDPRAPNAKTAVARNARLMVIFPISISSAERVTENHPCAVCLIQVNKPG